MGFVRKKREEPRVDLTSMVDMVFLLLIFFMISTTFVESSGIKVKLPQSSAQTLNKAPEEVKVYISKDGNIYFKDRQVSAEKLQGLLKDFGKKAGGMTFLLLADKDAHHGRVVQVMDIARDAGFPKLAIATEPRREH
jgi:biopolymer transport protein ExbD